MFYLIAFIASFCYVFLKAFQQLSVVHDRKAWVLPVSLLMATSEYFTVGSVALSFTDTESTFWNALGLIVSIGVGGGLGAILGMTLHKYMRSK